MSENGTLKLANNTHQVDKAGNRLGTVPVSQLPLKNLSPNGENTAKQHHSSTHKKPSDVDRLRSLGIVPVSRFRSNALPRKR
jgi:hypothetical protein